MFFLGIHEKKNESATWMDFWRFVGCFLGDAFLCGDVCWMFAACFCWDVYSASNIFVVHCVSHMSSRPSAKKKQRHQAIVAVETNEITSLCSFKV